MPHKHLSVMGSQNIRELIVVTSWYLCWKRRKLVHKKRIQDAKYVSMRIQALTTNYVGASSPKASMKRGVGLVPRWDM